MTGKLFYLIFTKKLIRYKEYFSIKNLDCVKKFVN